VVVKIDVGVVVRVKPIVENMVKSLASKLGYEPFTIRNTALLYGLMIVATSKKVPNTDAEFLELVEKVRDAIGRVV